MPSLHSNSEFNNNKFKILKVAYLDTIFQLYQLWADVVREHEVRPPHVAGPV